ncbi:HlyC/CorC family transporter [Acidipropionibacterium jensenii]|uniref:hemolysin family protein n=1 Tax=Acidipropionibacterium jensenii TaxID=1749 RepID=UPI00110A6378|nr:hemolysin family protein [Acidipropionibacterium jensenii]QCV87872.1 HlyC/CorC family transporter [Acidipropionibacterium jensenii]
MSPMVGLLITVALLGVNAFFVAGEFATTSSRRSQIEPLVEQRRRGSAKALYALEHVSHMLSICQLGVTVASTTLGAVAEPAIAHLLVHPLTSIGLPASSSHLVALVIALLLVVFLHVVFGEMVPKNISIAMPQNALLTLAPPLVAIGKVVAPVIYAMDHTANWFVRLAGLTPRTEIAAAFTTEEVASIVERSEEEGKIHDDLGLLSGSLEFTDRTVGEAMVPLADLVTLTPDCTPAQLEHEVSVTGFSRFPVSHHGRITGYLHVKDVLYAQGAEHDRPIGAEHIRQMETVRVDDEVEDAMRQMQRTGIHCAAVVPEAGSATDVDADASATTGTSTTTGGSIDTDRMIGVIFLEDILEELVGEVRDTLQRPQI